MSNNPTPANKESSEMKRDGPQHGTVRTVPLPWGVYPIPADRGLVNRLDSPPTAGMFNKVSRKPTNHSKFTSRHHGRQRCLCCHDHPVCKSKDKVKGTQKMKNGSGSDGSDIRLVSWRVVDSRPGLHISGFSDHLDDVGKNDVDHVDEGEVGGGDENGLTGDTEIGSGDIKGDDNDDKISFCDVWEEVIDEDEDEGWCLVG